MGNKTSIDSKSIRNNGPSRVPVGWCRFPAVVPVESGGANGKKTSVDSESMRSSADCRYSAVVFPAGTYQFYRGYCCNS